MKKIFFFIVAVVAIATMGSCSTQVSNRDYAFEAYCDSVWETDPDYYMDVLCETDEYCTYVETVGAWWE
jgi:hypothetical protein